MKIVIDNKKNLGSVRIKECTIAGDDIRITLQCPMKYTPEERRAVLEEVYKVLDRMNTRITFGK